MLPFLYRILSINKCIKINRTMHVFKICYVCIAFKTEIFLAKSNYKFSFITFYYPLVLFMYVSSTITPYICLLIFFTFHIFTITSIPDLHPNHFIVHRFSSYIFFSFRYSIYFFFNPFHIPFILSYSILLYFSLI